MKRRSQLVEQLQHIPLFENLSDAELGDVARIAARIREPAGELLIKEGEQGHEFLIVLEGQIEVRQRDRAVRTLGPGAYVGEMALLADPPTRTATVRAKTPVTIAFIGRREFEELVREFPSVGQRVRETFEERRRANAHLEDEL